MFQNRSPFLMWNFSAQNGQMNRVFHYLKNIYIFLAQRDTIQCQILQLFPLKKITLRYRESWTDTFSSLENRDFTSPVW